MTGAVPPKLGNKPTINESAVLSKYQGARVALNYVNTMNDVGLVSFIDDRWIELVKAGGDTLLVPVQAVRLIKMIAPPIHNTDHSENLLRASQSPPVSAEPVTTDEEVLK